MNEDILEKYGLNTTNRCIYFEFYNGYYTTTNGKLLTFDEEQYQEVVKACESNNIKSLVIT